MSGTDSIKIGDWVSYLEAGEFKVIRIDFGKDRLLLGDDETIDQWGYSYGVYFAPEDTFWADAVNCTKIREGKQPLVDLPTASYKSSVKYTIECRCNMQRLFNLGHDPDCEWYRSQGAVLGEE